MVDNNQGFAAVVSAIERLRDTAYNNTGLRVSVSRSRLLEERKQTDEIKRLFNLNKSQAKSGAVKSPNNWRDSDGRYSDGLATRLDNFLSDVGDIPKEIKKGFADVGDQFNSSIDKGFTKPLNNFGQSLTSQIQSIPKDFQQSIENSADKISDSFEKGSGEINKGLGRLEWSIKGTFWRLQAALPKPEPTKQQVRDTAFSSAIRGADTNSRAIAVAQRLAIKEQTEDLKEALGDLGDDSNTPMGIAKGMLSGVGTMLLAPVEATIFGYFQRVGESFAADFSDGMAKQAQVSMGLDWGEVGEDLGRIMGDYAYRIVDESAGMVRNMQLDSGSNPLIHVEKAVGKLVDDLFKAIAVQVPVAGAKAYRRMRINKEAIPQLKRMAGRAIIEEDVPEYQRQEIEEARSITLAVGGYNQDPDDFGKDYTSQLLKPLLGESSVIPVQRQDLSKGLDPLFERQLNSILESSLEDRSMRQSMVDMVKGSDFFNNLSGPEKREFFGDENLDLTDNKVILDTVQSLLTSEEFSIGKVIEQVFRGYGLDDLVVAAQAMKYRQQFPDKPINIVGFSQGGLQAAGATELLQRMGVDNVKGVGIGTTFTGTEYSGNAENFMSFVGEEDYYFKAFSGMLEAMGGSPDYMQTAPKEGIMHSLPSYVSGPNFKAELQSFLGDRVKVAKDSEYSRSDAKALYEASKDGSMTSVLRSVLDLLGVEEIQGVSRDRFGFGSAALKADPNTYVGDIIKSLKKVKNPEVKEFLNQYLGFLEDLREELERAEVAKSIGETYIPDGLREKAQAIFPQLEQLPTEEMPKPVPDVRAARQQKERIDQTRSDSPLLRDFVAKLNQEKINFQRSFLVMMGDSIPKDAYAYFDPTEYETRANEHLGGLLGWLKGDDWWGKASEAEKGAMLPYIQFLEDFQQSLLSVGREGKFDAGVFLKAQELFGVKLPAELEKAIGTKPKQIDVKGKDVTKAIAKRQGKTDRIEDYPEFVAYIEFLNRELEAYNQKNPDNQRELLDPNTVKYLGSGKMAHAFYQPRAKGPGTVFKASRIQNSELTKPFESLIVSAGLGIANPNELAAMEAAQSSGVSPRLESAGGRHIEMQFFDGQNLKQSLQGASPEKIKQTLTQVGQILKALHDAGVSHNDFHLGNIVDTAEGLKAIDFGRAKPNASNKEKAGDVDYFVKNADYFLNQIGKADGINVRDLVMSGYSPQPMPEPIADVGALEEFQAWIEAITQESIALAKQNIEVFLQGFQQLSPADKKTQIRDFSTEINQIVQEFRTAIASGDNQLALDLLESGIRRIEQIREIYAQLSDPSLGMDTSALNLRSAKGALTSLRNELLTGQPNMQGRSPIGGEQLVSQAEAAAATGDSGAAQFLAELQAKIQGESGEELQALKLSIGDIALVPVREFSASAIAVFDALSVAISKYLEPVRQSHLFARLAKLDDSLAQAKEMAGSQSVTADASKPMVFAVGGLMGFGGKGGDYWQKHLEALGINQENANIEYPDYTNTDSNVPLTNPVGFVKSGVGNIIRNHSEGQNPDAIALASKVIAFREQNPDTPVNLLGHSAGADVVSEAIAILERGGYQGIKGTGVAGVDYGAQLPTENYRNLPGENDVVVNALRPIGTDRSLTEFGGMTATRGHGIGGYRRHPEFIARLDESLQATAALNALKDYLSQFEDATGDRLAGALEDARAFAQQFKEVFTFDVDGSPVDGLLTAIDSRLESLRGDNLSAFSFGLNDALDNAREAGGSIADEINKLKATIAKDLEYLRAVATGDTAKAQAMVGDAAKGAGYGVGPVYHGTDVEGIQEFEKGKAWWTENPKVTREFGDTQYSAFLKFSKLAQDDTRKSGKSSLHKSFEKFTGQKFKREEIDDGVSFDGEDYYGLKDDAVNEPKFNSFLRKQKHDGIKVWDDSNLGPDSFAYVPFNPNQIKSADAVTKTNDGKPVPLSARFDDSVADIRGNVNDIFAGLKSQAGEALQPLIAELETQFAAMGDNSINSLINSLEGLMGQLRGTGGDVGDSLKDGVDGSLDMHSPSEEMRNRGENAGDSFGMGAVESLRAAGNAISAEINKLKATIDKDLEYLRAVATGDTAKAQAMVGDAAKGAGYNVGPVYHGTKAEFTEFDTNLAGRNMGGNTFGPKGIWFTKNKEKASSWAKQGRVIDAYVKPGSIIDDAGALRFGRDRFADPGVDSIVTNNVVVAKRSNQIKSADAVTKTNDGKPVPLSARFDDSVADIRGNVNDIFAGLKSQAGEALQPLIAELETQFAAMGDNSINSLINSLEGLMGQLRGTGGDVGDELAEGTETALDMDSPSKVYKAIGQNIIAGLEGGLEGFDGTLEEKRKLLDTYVKSVIELVYDLPKVTGEATTQAQKVRKLFQDIGQAGTATTQQLNQAQGYFPELGLLAKDSPAAATYLVRKNKILVNPDRQEQLPDDLMHEYSHALQGRFGLGTRWANKAQDYLREKGVLGRRAEADDPMVKTAAGRSAKSFMDQMGVNPESRQYQAGFDHIYGAETEAYANELGIGKERKRRGFFKADAEEIAAQIKAAKAEAKKAALELKEAGKEVTEAIGHGFEEGKQFSQDVLANVMNWLENIPILGLLVKLARGIGSAIGGLFSGQKATPQVAKQKPPKQAIAEAMQSVEMPEVVKPTESLIKPIQQTAEQIRQKAAEISASVDQSIEEKLAELETIAELTETAIATEIDTKQIADQWLAGIKDWLKQLGKGFEAGLGGEIAQLKADGKNVAEELKEKAADMEWGLDEKQAQFRQAIADGNAELSKAIGTELLEQSEQLRILFKEVAKNIKFFEGRGLWRDEAARMQALQKEVIQGRRGKDFAKTGIYQAIASGQIDPAANQQALKTEIPYEYVPVSFGMEPPEVEPVTVELEPGELQLPELEPMAAEVEAAKIEIPDPDTLVVPVVAEVDEDGGGFTGFLDTIKEALDQSDTVIGDFIAGLSDSITNGMDALEGLYGEVKQVFPGVEGVKDLFVGLGIAAGGAMVVQGLVGAIGMLGGVSLDALVGLESMERAFLALTGSSESAKRSMKFARDEANRLGVDLLAIEEAYMGLSAATRGTALEGSATDAILSSFAETASLRGLDTEQQGSMFTALQQVIGKRKLSAEEVRQQLGEIPGLDFQGTLARGMGISVGQLDDLMSSGQLLAEDVLPQVAAQYAAENAVVANSSETTGQAIARFNNSLIEFQRSLQSSFGFAKQIFNGMASLITWFGGAMPGIIGLLTRLGLVMAWGPASVLVSMLQTQVAGQSFAAVMQTIGTTLARILPTIGKFLAQMILMELAFDAIGAVVDVVKSPFEEWDKSLQKATKSVEALEKAYSKLATIKPVDELGGGWTNRVTRQLLQGETKNNLPVNPEDVLTSDTWNLFGLDTGMNLEFARKGFKGLGIGGKTLGQRQQEMAGERVGNTVSASQRTLALEEEARADLESIKELDRQLARVQLKRMDNVAGDREAYNAMIAEEKALQERRKAILDKTATFQQSVQDNIENVKKSLSELETQKDQTEISAGEYESRKSRLDLELEALEASRDEFEKSASSIQVASNALALALQKLNENYAAFNENMERQASRTRTQFLRQAQASGTGSTVRSMGLSALESDDLTLRVSFLREQLGEINNNLSDPDFARQLEELKIESEAMGVDINNSATLDRIIGDAGNKYKNVAETLKRSLELETELAQTEEQLAQSSVDMEQSLFDLSNVIEDFFQQLTQQFEEARIELDRVKNQLRYGGLKQKLQKALVPGSNSFINGVIGSIQGIFDQASSVMESVLGQRSARLSFAGEKYSLDNQMTDFARSVNGATQAVEAFRASLAGGQATLNNAGQSGAVATNRGGGVGNVSGTLGYIGSTGRSTGPHLDLRGFTGGDRQSRMTEARLKQIARDFEVGGKPLSSAPITSGYGMRVHPVTGQRAMHPGLDYGIPMGTPITYKGQAVKINQRANFGGAGNTIEIVLPTGEIVQLLHLQKFGQAVIQSAQTAIASNATGPTKTAKASFYGGPSDPTRWHGRKTASGEVYDENGLTVAVPYRSKSDKRPSIPFGTYLLVTNPANGKQVVVRVTDTGNFGTDAQYGGRGLDLSYGAAKQLGTVQSGVANVNYQVVDKNQRPAPVATNVSYSQPQQQAIVATTPDPAIARGQKLTADIVNLKGQIVDGNGQINQQKVQEVILSLQQYTQELNRGIDDNLRGLGNINADARDTFAGLMQQFSPQTLESQSEADRRQTATTLRQTSNELFERSRAQEDEIKGAKKTVAASKAIIAEITANPSAIPEEAQVEAEAIKVLENTISKIEGEIIPQYEKALALTKEQEKQLGAVSAQAEKWLEVQRQQRQLDQDGEMIALRASVAQASFNEQLKLKADLETVDNEFEKRKLQEQQRLIDQPELLKDVLAQLEKERDAKKKNLQYDFDALIRGRELEAVGRQLGLAQSEFNSEKILSLEIAQAELEAENNRLKILREVTDETEKARQLELTDAEKLQKIRRAELDNINRILDRKQGDRDLDSRQAENAANLSRNPFAATQLRENNAIANRQLEFERRAEEIRQTQPADRAAAMIAQESEILAQDLELIDREFRDLSETIGDNLGNAFNSFTDALISGDNALQAFTNALLKSVSDIGSQLMQQGMQGLMQNIFGKSGAIGGLFGGGGNPVASVGSILPGMITPFMGPKLFADGGYTGDGGKYEAKGIVHGGEFVINKAATRKIGLPALMTANTLGQLPGYATGGYVGSVESRLLSGLNSTRMPSTLPSENRRSPVTAGPVSNTVNVNINDRESRFFKQSRTLAREIADELRV